MKILSELGGKRWLKSVGLHVDEATQRGLSWSIAVLARDVAAPKTNRVMIHRQQQGVHRVEYWRVEVGNEDIILEAKSMAMIDDVKVELAMTFTM